MCGICGQWNKEQPIEKAVFDGMRDTLTHRGPDASGSVLLEAGRLGLGHRRLSIIDLDPRADQPMHDPDNETWVVFNGEIYNYKALRNELSCHSFQTESDTEVLLKAYGEWGLGMLDRLKGMFAFALWDGRKRQLILARDRFGIKPLFYFQSHDRLLFASEVKAMLGAMPREFDYESLADYFVYRFLPSPGGAWKDVRKLPPAHYLVVSQTGSRLESYWRLEPGEEPRSPTEAAESLDQKLKVAVNQHLVSDVPVGLFLSGGYDSTTLCRYLKAAGHDTHSFTLGFTGSERSEHELARQVAHHFQTRHVEEMMDQIDVLELAKTLVYHFDEPFGGSSQLPTFLLSRVASEKVKVVLGGDGGDELLAGYRHYPDLYRSWYRGPLGRVARTVKGDQAFLCDLYDRQLNWTGWRFTDLGRVLNRELLGDLFLKDDHWLHKRHLDLRHGPIKAMQLLDYHTFLPDVVLQKVDRAGMAHGLEVRVPFLDHELVEEVFRLQVSAYFDPTEKKLLLSRLFGSGLPPQVKAAPKRGFGLPLARYLNEGELRDFIARSKAVGDGILQAGVAHLKEMKNLTRLWAVFLFAMWYERWR